ncbi:DUF6675 family protein [Treponema endosymbiont of Eucomonympha sp.]|uniref:DUF6675 family protein n=1 Tax=Treponema endosymbiont of Eucomonympha sp. TaxID=1580831 RepID=UPI000A6B118F
MFLRFCIASLCVANDTNATLRLETILNAKYCRYCRKKRHINSIVARDNNLQLSLCPKTVLGNKAGALWRQDYLPTYSGESLYLIKKPTERNDTSKATEAVKAGSTMEGITYYSNRRKQIEVLYPRCCLVDNPVNRNRIPDRIGTIPEDETFYLFQTGNSLGDCLYSVNFWQTSTEVLVCPD